MDFDNDVFELSDHCKSKKIRMTQLPNSKDVYFQAKRQETVDRYSAARRFMYETETDDWDHYFKHSETPNADLFFQTTYRAQFYEAALMFYNSVVDLSWITCYIAAESFVYSKDGVIDIQKIMPIEDAYDALRKAENMVQNPNADDSFSYLKKVCPEFSTAIDIVIRFWSSFADSEVRKNYNYLKHKGNLLYNELDLLQKQRLFRFVVNGNDCPSDVTDVQKRVSLNDSIEELRRFDDLQLYPYIDELFRELKRVVNPSDMIL